MQQWRNIVQILQIRITREFINAAQDELDTKEDEANGKKKILKKMKVPLSRINSTDTLM